MEIDSSPHFLGYSPEQQDPAPARNVDQSRERVPGSDLMVMEDDLSGLNQNKLDLRKVLDDIEEKASQVFNFTLKWEEMDKQYTTMERLLKERTMEVELKEKSVKENGMKQYLESSVKRLVLEKSNEQVMVELEERVKEVERLSKANDEKSRELSKTVKEFDLKQQESTERMSKEAELVEESLKQLEAREKEISLLDEAVKAKATELERKEEILEAEQKAKVEEMELKSKFLEVKTKKLEEWEKEVETLSKLNDEKSCELERTVKEFDLKQKISAERRSKEAELVEKSLKQLEARENEISLLDEVVKAKATELERKEEILEAQQKAKAEEMESKSELLKLKEHELEEREKELKKRELEERSRTCKRSRGKLLAEKGSEAADSLNRPTKKHKTLGEQIKSEEKETDWICLVSASASSLEQLNEADEEEIDEIVSKGDTNDEDPEQIICVDSEFHDFRKTMSSFMVGQIWALYDPRDEMPRYYARIKRIIKSRLSFEVTWFEPIDEESVHVACGWFKYGITETVKSHLTFSHEMHPIRDGKNFMDVKPIKGETWALFSDWNKSWNNNPKQHKPPYNYDLVEVVLSFDDHAGIGVAYLGKVDGFVSVFRHSAQHGVCSLMIPPEEMQRFSHRVPSIRLNGEEKKGVPAGSFELDPAAVPTSILEEAKAIQGQSQDCSKSGALIITFD